MATTELLMSLFQKRVDELKKERGLTEAEAGRIITAFQQALSNSFMNESQIYSKLIEETICK